MQYYSLNGISPKVSFREATLNGLAPDKGLYFPESIPRLSPDFIKNIENLPDHDIAFEVIAPYIGNTISELTLMNIIEETLTFPFPLVQVTGDIYSVELFHGPTLAFKDVGARFMARCLGFFLKDENQKVTVLVATSGDTGGAVADGFFNVEGVEVVILYPEGKVSEIQEMQLTTHGNNISAIAVSGSFDDCQKMVKEAFNDAGLTKKKFLTSANSINVARWLPQQFYYFFVWKYWGNKELAPVISVPSGNFGNICAGLLTKVSGLPINHFIAACNSNDVFYDYLQTGIYKSKVAEPTISNAMDVGDPSNLKRVLEICKNDIMLLRNLISPFSCSTEETKKVIGRIYEQCGYLMDPHGAIGFLALEKYILDHPGQKGVFLETAHPVKFLDAIESIIKTKIPIPSGIQRFAGRNKMVTKMDANYVELKEYLLSN